MNSISAGNYHNVLPGHAKRCNGKLTVILLIILISLVGGCVTSRRVADLYPPVMELDELSRPYGKIAVIECNSMRFGNLAAVTAQDLDWANHELRERAHMLGADAVILPEVRAERDTFLFFPTSTIKAKGIAIKFR